jgi:DNA-binding NarL/FixJ family response regulator
LITSTNREFIESAKRQFEQYITHSIVFNVQDGQTTETTIAWMWYVSRTADLMIVDIDTCSWVDVCTALTKEVDEDHEVIFFSEKNKKREAIRLINATGKYLILRNVEQLEDFIKIQLLGIQE